MGHNNHNRPMYTFWGSKRLIQRSNNGKKHLEPETVRITKKELN